MTTQISHIIALIFLGFLPSIVWLLFYLRRDVYPEPREMIIKVFSLGMLVTLPIVLIQIAISKALGELSLSFLFIIALQFFIVIALTEEWGKYFAVRFGALRNVAFDEPIDAMIYMIVSGLGFAAVENILVLFSAKPPNFLSSALSIIFLRFVSATILHALASANIGYFMALSIYHKKYRFFIISFGIIFSSFLHGIYNLGINMEGNYKFLTPFLVLSLFFILVLAQFQNIRKLKSVCKI